MDWTLHYELARAAGIRDTEVWREVLVALGRRWLKWGDHTLAWIAILSARLPGCLVLAQRSERISGEPSCSLASGKGLGTHAELAYLEGVGSDQVSLHGEWNSYEPLSAALELDN
jgi:hypothetical protein